MQETLVPSLGEEDPLEEGVATHSSILAWRIPWTEQPDGLQSTGSQRVRRNCMHAHTGQWMSRWMEGWVGGWMDMPQVPGPDVGALRPLLLRSSPSCWRWRLCFVIHFLPVCDEYFTVNPKLAPCSETVA